MTTGTEIWLNTSRPPFADARLRRAFNYALDRRALIQEEEASGPRFYPTAQYLPPSLPGYRALHVYSLGAPDLTLARRIAGPGSHGSAVLYSGVYPQAQDRIIARALRAIGIHEIVRRFSLEELFARERCRGEPFDLVAGGYQIDFADPFDVLNLALDGRYIGESNAGNFSHFNDPSYNAELRAAALLSGPARYRAYARLDQTLAQNAAPMAAWGILASQDLFSARVGCQTYQPLYGMDLGALCLRR
jgi:peptide/nickel transport system substrate-binding protein